MDKEELRERIARAVEPNTWNGIDQMESIGRAAPYLRAQSEHSLAAADSVIEVLVSMGLEVLAEEAIEAGGRPEVNATSAAEGHSP